MKDVGEKWLITVLPGAPSNTDYMFISIKYAKERVFTKIIHVDIKGEYVEFVDIVILSDIKPVVKTPYGLDWKKG